MAAEKAMSLIDQNKRLRGPYLMFNRLKISVSELFHLHIHPVNTGANRIFLCLTASFDLKKTQPVCLQNNTKSSQESPKPFKNCSTLFKASIRNNLHHLLSAVTVFTPLALSLHPQLPSDNSVCLPLISPLMSSTA